MLTTTLLLFFLSGCCGQGMVPITPTEDLPLKEISNLAKTISHSKGTIIKSKDEGYEYRRSFTSKVELQVNSLQLKTIISEIEEKIPHIDANKPLVLKNLDILESLVRQYDIGKQFVHLGGLELVLRLTEAEDGQVSKTAFLVLSAAMQGNLEVQKYASSTTLLEQIIKTISISSRVNEALLTLSAFIRNCPACVNSFINEKGVLILSNLLNNSNIVTKIHLRSIDILGDIAAELFGENGYCKHILVQAKRTFKADVFSSSVCDKIVDALFASVEYTAHEKITASLHQMFDICNFQQSHLSKRLKYLLEQYDIAKPQTIWYPPLVDLELRYNLFLDLKKLHKKSLILEKNNHNNVFKKSKSFKTEL